MAHGWDGANGVTKDQKCSICGKKTPAQALRIFHALNPGWLEDHRVVCHGCADVLIPSEWHGCGCGG